MGTRIYSQNFADCTIIELTSLVDVSVPCGNGPDHCD